MNTIRQALLELINLQKQKLSQQDVQIRYLSNELCKHTTSETSVTSAEIGERLTVYGEAYTLVSRDRSKGKFTLQLVEAESWGRTPDDEMKQLKGASDE